jgi:2-polyprenyl-3-methyl-5-hydroxy-6-metoxy-1,4-benzoquinol methylase
MSNNLSSYNFIPSFEEYKERAKNPAFTLNEKCGAPEALRSGQSARIYADICSKLTVLTNPGVNLLDIGAGCSELAHYIIETTGRNGQSLTVIDSREMLSLLPDKSHLNKVEGPFPDCIHEIVQPLELFDAILSYSVVQTTFRDSNLFAFVDTAVQLLKDQGQLLIGDIPNATMRKRFMASLSGRVYHEIHYCDLPKPTVVFNSLQPGQIDDGVILGLVARMRAAGLHAFAVPQGPNLPMANRREDILIIKP